MVPKRALEEPKKLNFASPSPWNTLPREVHMDSDPTHLNDGETTESPVDGHDQPKIYTIRDQKLEVLMHPSVPELHAATFVYDAFPWGGLATGRCGEHAQASRQAKQCAPKGILMLLSCDKAFQDPCHFETREQKYVQQHIRICTHGAKTGLG